MVMHRLPGRLAGEDVRARQCGRAGGRSAAARAGSRCPSSAGTRASLVIAGRGGRCRPSSVGGRAGLVVAGRSGRRGPPSVGGRAGLVIIGSGGHDLRGGALCALGVGPEFRHPHLNEDFVYNPHLLRDEEVHDRPGGGVTIRL